MRSAAKQYNCINKDMDSMKSFDWSRGVITGFSNGSDDIKSRESMVSGIKVVHQRRYGEEHQGVWLKGYSLSGRNLKFIRLVDPLSVVSVQRLSTGSLSKEELRICLPSPPYPEYSLNMARRARICQKETAVISHIHISGQRRWEISTRQTLLALAISEVQEGLHDSIPSTPWMWQVIRSLQASLIISRLSPCAGIWLIHGEIWGFRKSPRWIMKWPLPVEADIDTVYPRLSGFICFWGYIWYSFRKENLEETPLSRASMPSGRRESFRGMNAQQYSLLEEPASDSWTITIMRNHTGGLLTKNMVQDSPVCSGIISGRLFGICLKSSASTNTLGLMDILSCLFREEGFPLSGRSTLMEESRSMGSPILSEENLKASMLLLRYLLIEENSSLNRTRKLSSLFLFQLRIILLLLCFLIQTDKRRIVIDVMIILSIRNQLSML